MLSVSKKGSSRNTLISKCLLWTLTPAGQTRTRIYDLFCLKPDRVQTLETFSVYLLSWFIVTLVDNFYLTFDKVHVLSHWQHFISADDCRLLVCIHLMVYISKYGDKKSFQPHSNKSWQLIWEHSGIFLGSIEDPHLMTDSSWFIQFTICLNIFLKFQSRNLAKFPDDFPVSLANVWLLDNCYH